MKEAYKDTLKDLEIEIRNLEWWRMFIPWDKRTRFLCKQYDDTLVLYRHYVELERELEEFLDWYHEPDDFPVEVRYVFPLVIQKYLNKEPMTNDLKNDLKMIKTTKGTTWGDGPSMVNYGEEFD